jgi:hypothetical protein
MSSSIPLGLIETQNKTTKCKLFGVFPKGYKTKMNASLPNRLFSSS